MIQRKYETVVGIFVVGSLAALLIMVLIIAQQERLWQEHVQYKAIFKNISGLKVGSEVRLAGVTVGNVKEITIDTRGKIIVSFEVVGKYRSRVREDSRATIGYMGLLGEKSLDLTAGSPDQPEIAAGGQVTSMEPWDITELFAKATPSLEKVEKLLTNLTSLSESLTKPGSKFGKSMEELSQIVAKINQGQGSLGQILNDPALYRESAQTMTNIRKFTASLEEGKGALGTLINDPALKGDLQKTLTNLSRITENLKETTSRLPELVKNAEAFMQQINRAGKGLPELVTTGQGLVSDADKVTKAAQKSWLLRSNIPKPTERTITIEREQKKE